jgi:hypothetical protein
MCVFICRRGALLRSPYLRDYGACSNADPRNGKPTGISQAREVAPDRQQENITGPTCRQSTEHSDSYQALIMLDRPLPSALASRDWSQLPPTALINVVLMSGRLKGTVSGPAWPWSVPLGQKQ